MSSLTSFAISLLGGAAAHVPQPADLQAAESPSIELRAGLKTPEGETEPVETLKCKIEWATGQRGTFTLRAIGRRGYRDPVTAEIRSTNEKLEFIDDPEKLFDGYGGWWAVRGGFEAESGSPKVQFGSRVALRFDRTEFSLTRRPLEVRTVTVSSFQDWMPLAKAVGFCDVTYVLQKPLSSTEIAKLGTS